VREKRPRLGVRKGSHVLTTIPWLPFLAPIRSLFYLTYLLQAYTWGLCPPQPVPLLGHAPSPSPLLPVGSGYFSAKPLLVYKYPSNLVLVILTAYSAYE